MFFIPHSDHISAMFSFILKYMVCTIVCCCCFYVPHIYAMQCVVTGVAQWPRGVIYFTRNFKILLQRRKKKYTPQEPSNRCLTRILLLLLLFLFRMRIRNGITSVAHIMFIFYYVSYYILSFSSSFAVIWCVRRLRHKLCGRRTCK